ncbi:hypothetical protein BD626DRAFT_573474 [Schizophyllum amplum]|uniref:non-specific serine/threonine protein kinase n=1 Tax=Schizophyllum amplum TaxID=97359 RepID=A0A550C105_9AGAR|nr:hypothetical protein BD626DRAFT_573474 [Auriculariopsis ampla]
MEPVDEAQQNELTALKSIYADDFIESAASNVWKGATKLPEFSIRVRHPDSDHGDNIFFQLHVRFPKTYPALVCPIFTIQKPMSGITNDQVTKLNRALHAEAQANKGTEMVFQIASFCQEWLGTHVVPPKEAPGSLALQMNQRTEDEERARKQREDAEREAAHEAEAIRRWQLSTQIQAEQQARESELVFRSRRRAGSEATEVPSAATSEIPTETFPAAISFAGLRFDTVRVFHPRTTGRLGRVYMADPVTDGDEDSSKGFVTPLEIFEATFDGAYYSTSQGRKKLKQLAAEVTRLTQIRHANVLAVLAVKLHIPNSHAPPRLVVLTEQAPPVALQDVLQDCAALREDRAMDYLGQILSGLNVVHLQGLVHRGIDPHCIFLAPRDPAAGHPSNAKLVRIGRVSFHTRLRDLYRSNPWGLPANNSDTVNLDGDSTWAPDDGDNAFSEIPDGWLSKDVKNESALVYTARRDIHAVGIVFLQMLLGLDVMKQFDDIRDAVHAPFLPPSARQIALSMIGQHKSVTCISLLAELASLSKAVPVPPRTPANMQNGHNGKGAAQNGHPAYNANGTQGWVSSALPISTLSPNGGTPMNGTTNWLADQRTPGAYPMVSGSPESGYFHAPAPRMRHASRWKEDWIELEILGRGGFGSVVKARNKLDQKVYAVKKIRLKAQQADARIFREVNALSVLKSQFIVRYYGTWVETVDAPSTVVSDDEDSGGLGGGGDSFTHEDGFTHDNEDDDLTHDGSRTRSGSRSHSAHSAPMSVDLSELDRTKTRSESFLSIYFEDSGAHEGEGSSSDSDGGSDDLIHDGGERSSLETGDREDSLLVRPQSQAADGPPVLPRTLYIQMEFVERQTLKELVREGIAEQDSWRLFSQILSALVEMKERGIIHRDIKPQNVFIVGDFGLATSSLAAVDPSDVSPSLRSEEVTFNVGTYLYIAPEVSSKKRGSRNHSKADMYSLGIVFFEMNFRFNTDAERIAIISNLRRPEVVFPTEWDQRRERQRQIITWLLQHDPDDRPNAVELSESNLLPPRVEEEYLKNALEMMAKPDSLHRSAVLSSLFNQPPRPARGYLYDADVPMSEHASLNYIAEERLAAVFRLHGAIDTEPPLLMTETSTNDSHATFLDRFGDVVMLPADLIVSFARLAARKNSNRIKRYHIADIFKSNGVAGHPKFSKAAVFDIISKDLVLGPIAAGVEMLSVASSILDSFPNLSQAYEIHITHSEVIECAFDRVPEDLRSAVRDILMQHRSSPSQKRTALAKKGISNSVIQELDLLVEPEEDIDAWILKLEKTAPFFLSGVRSALTEIKKTLQLASATGVKKPIIFRPLMLNQFTQNFEGGIVIQVVRRNKRMDVLAMAGRYDHLIARYTPPNVETEPLAAYGMQVFIDRITMSLVDYQISSVKALVKEQRSFGFWSPRRCDVYVVSFHPGYLQDRLDIVADLWKNNISADLMYDSGLPNNEYESAFDICAREGILFTVYPRPRGGKRDQLVLKVKSLLKGTEYELSRSELVPWLQQQISEQKRIDLATSGAPMFSDPTAPAAPKESTNHQDLQLLLPVDTKKQRKVVKQMFTDRAFETSMKVKTTAQTGMPTLAVDLPPAVFDAMVKSPEWITDEEAWRSIMSIFPTQHSAYAQQVREAAVKRKEEKCAYILLYAVKEDRIQLLALS